MVADMVTSVEPNGLLSFEERISLKKQLGQLGIEHSEIQEQIRRANEELDQSGIDSPPSDFVEWRNSAHGAMRAKARDIARLKILLGQDGELRRQAKEERRANRVPRPRYQVTGNVLASTKLLVDLFHAACVFIEDDSDENYDRLADIVDSGRAMGLESEAPE